MLSFLASGWTFFFRWPVIRVSAEAFSPASIFLGPAFQAFAFALAAGLVALLPSAPLGLAGFLGFVVLSAVGAGRLRWCGVFAGSVERRREECAHGLRGVPDPRDRMPGNRVGDGVAGSAAILPQARS